MSTSTLETSGTQIKRGSNGRITAAFKRKVMVSLSHYKISAVNKRIVQQWWTANPVVVAGSSVETALNDINAVFPLW